MSRIKGKDVEKLYSIIEKLILSKFDKTESVAPARKSVNTLAREVIQGKWGNGEECKKRLSGAGYDYNAVQKRVNEMLK